MVRDRALTFLMCIPCGKTFSLVPKSKSSYEVRKYQGYIFRKLKVPIAAS